MSGVLYPVVNIITGTTPRGGGVWKDILHAHPQGLLRRNLPVMTQALHFLDYKMTPAALVRWRQKPLRAHYNGNLGLHWTAPLFADSGGFTLMHGHMYDLSAYGLRPDTLQEDVFRLQLDLGADMVASLDVPLPPGLSRGEVERRLALTRENALRAAQLAAALPSDRRPRLFVPVHGPTPEVLASFITDVLARLEAEGLREMVTGLALGSMVPRRKAGQDGEVLAFVRAAREAMPADMPLHVFGVTGTLTPFLLAAGVTSFDSSAYVQNARALQYRDPRTLRFLSLHDLDTYPCDCAVCRERDAGEDKAVLDGRVPRSRKSAVYAAIALHNLGVDMRLLDEALAAREAGSLDAFLRELSRRYPQVRWPKEAKQPRLFVVSPSFGTVREHHPDDYDLRARAWEPEEGKRVLLFLPCSQAKPYTRSRSFGYVWRHVLEALGREVERVQVVFISGLYGPVPMRHVEEDAVSTYDFLLRRWDAAGVARVAERLADFLRRYGPRFDAVVAYLTRPAYRSALKRAARMVRMQVTLIPETAERMRFYNEANMTALTDVLQEALGLPLAEPQKPQAEQLSLLKVPYAERLSRKQGEQAEPNLMEDRP